MIRSVLCADAFAPEVWIGPVSGLRVRKGSICERGIARARARAKRRVRACRATLASSVRQVSPFLPVTLLSYASLAPFPVLR